jgi:hypothetical protein
MKLIESKTLVSTTSEVEFVSIPQSFTDLTVLISARTSSAAVLAGITLKLNGTTTGFTGRRLWGSGVSPTTDTETFLFIMNGDTSTANSFSNTSIYIPNYSGSTNKSFSADGVMENNATTSYLGLHAGLWSNTSAITSLSIGTNLLANSVISLYGITKGSDGIVTTS